MVTVVVADASALGVAAAAVDPPVAVAVAAANQFSAADMFFCSAADVAFGVTVVLAAAGASVATSGVGVCAGAETGAGGT